MIDWNLFGPFVIAVIMVAVVPGPDMILIATLGSLQGPKAGVAAAAGMPVGTVVHVGVVAAGVSAALRSCPTVFEAVQWAGVGYLLYLASKTWRSAGVCQDRWGSLGKTALGQCFARFAGRRLLTFSIRK